MTNAVVPSVVRVGGALVVALTALDEYVDSKKTPLKKRGQIAIARLVEDRPHLNTPESVSLLIDLAAFHGVSQMTELGRQIDEYGIIPVHLSVDYLFECGERSLAGDKANLRKNGFEFPTRYKTGMDSVRNMAALIVDLAEVTGDVPENIETLNDLIDRLGGLDDTLDMNIAQMHKALGDDYIEALGNNDVEDGESDPYEGP